MVRPVLRFILIAICAAAVCAPMHAQKKQTATSITVRMLDSRNGRVIPSNTFLVRINHQPIIHSDWITSNEDGSATLTLPPEARDVIVQATYDSSTQIYINCDSLRKKEPPADQWYAVSDLVKFGVAAANGCGKHRASALAGELVFFVRKQNWKEEMQDYLP